MQWTGELQCVMHWFFSFLTHYNCISSIVREVEKSFHFKLMTPKHHYFQRMRWEHSHSLKFHCLLLLVWMSLAVSFFCYFCSFFFLKFEFIVHPIEWVATRNIFDIHKWNNEVRRYRIKRSQLTRKRRSKKTTQLKCWTWICSSLVQRYEYFQISHSKTIEWIFYY